MTAVWLGALLVIAGVVYMAWAAMQRGRMSDPHPTATGTTLEPARRGVGFLGLGPNWPGILMVLAGVILLFGGLL